MPKTLACNEWARKAQGRRKMNDATHQEYRNRIIEEATEWFVRLQEPEISADDRADFAQWLTASSEHVHEYLALTALRTDIGELAPRRSVEQLIRLASASRDTNVIPLRSQSPVQLESKVAVEGQVSAVSPRNISSRWHWAGIAACTTLLALISWWWRQPDPDIVAYATAIGEQKSFTLPDSSVVTLNAVSRLQVRYSKEYRDIHLLSGEALFDVAKNPQRPFRVMTLDSVIQAVGTRFNVRRRQDDTTITVVEGRVKVASPKIGGGHAADVPQELAAVANDVPSQSSGGWTPVAAGERAHLVAPGVIDVSAVDTTANIAWRDRRLVFESRPLSEVVAEFNLYNELPLAIRDSGLNGIAVSGSFRANDPQSFCQFLEEAKIARTQAQNGAIVLISAR